MAAPWDPAAAAAALESTKNRLRMEKELATLHKEQVEAIGQHATASSGLSAAVASQLADRERLLALAEEHHEEVKKEFHLQQGLDGLARRKVEMLQSEIEILKKKNATEADPAKRRHNLKEIRDIELRTQKVKKGAAAAEQLGVATAGSFKINEAKSFTAGLSAMAKVMGAGVEGAILLGAALLGSLPIVFMANMIGLTMALFDNEKQFMKTTGASEKYAKQVTRSYEVTRQFGVSMKEASEAAASLYATFTNFTFLSEKLQDDLINTGALLHEQGVSFKSYSSGIQTATKALGIAAGDADDMMMRLTAHARDIEVEVGTFVDEFAAMAPELAALGDKAEQAFKDLGNTFKITGFEMQKILQLTSKFDTFEDAATMAGGLNAALGGNFVNAMDMMMETDPVRRFDMLRDAILNAGLTFESMHYYQRKFFAEQLGFGGDVLKLSMLMSGNYEALDKDINKSAASYEEMQNRAAALQTIQESLQNLLVAFVPILKPMIVSLTKFLEGLHETTKETKETTSSFLSWIPAIWLAAKAVGAIIGFFYGTSGLIAGISALVSVTAWGPLGIAIGFVIALAGAFKYLMGTMTEEHSLSLVASFDPNVEGSLPAGLEALGVATKGSLPAGLKAVGKTVEENIVPQTQRATAALEDLHAATEAMHAATNGRAQAPYTPPAHITREGESVNNFYISLNGDEVKRMFVTGEEVKSMAKKEVEKGLNNASANAVFG